MSGEHLVRQAAAVKTRDVVFTFWQETWTNSRQRRYMTPDRFVQGLLTHERVGGLLIADALRMGPTQVLRRVLGRKPAPIPRRPHPTSVLSPLRLRRKDGTGEAALRATYRDYDRRIAARSQEMGLQSPAIITTSPLYAAYGLMDWSGPVTYYAFDDWAAYDDHEKWWPDYIRAYEIIRERGHRVCAVSQHLLNRINPSGPSRVVPNGIAGSEWQPPWDAPEWAVNAPHPRIIYTGAIHRRLDVGAVRQIAERFPNGSILIVGPVHHPDVASELSAIPSVDLRPALPRDQVAGLTHSADVCIMPHHRNALTESMSPLKIYEYCAAGRPVTATDMSPVRNIHANVVLVAEGASFADGVEKALALGPLSEVDRQNFLGVNSWRGRHDALLDLALSD